MDQELTPSEKRRDRLDALLREIQINNWGYQHTYFEPPENVEIQYNAIVYEKIGFHSRKANNRGYIIRDEYQVTVISNDPETEVPRAILESLEHCSPGKIFVRDNLWHYPITIYY